MSRNTLDEWRAFCEGTIQIEKGHSSYLFEDIWSQPMNDRNLQFLVSVFSFLPQENREQMLKAFILFTDSHPDINDSEARDLIQDDLEMQQSELATSNHALKPIVFAESEFDFDNASRCVENFNRQTAVEEYFQGYPLFGNRIVQELHSYAYYRLSYNNYRVVNCFTSRTIGASYYFEPYYRLYLSGIDYVLTPTEIVAINYRRINDTN